MPILESTWMALVFAKLFDKNYTKIYFLALKNLIEHKQRKILNNAISFDL